MGDRSKFEQMLEYLINDEETKARELFHDIVVAKSREIYENLLADDFDDETEESRGEEEEGEEENMDMMASPEEEAFGGDQTDDMLGDVEAGDDDMGGMDDMDDMGGGGEEELGDRLDDLESELEALRDEFESLMGDEGGDDMGGDDMGGDDMGGMDDMGDEEEPTKDSMYFEKRDEDDEEEEEEEEESRSDEAFIREYVEKVGGKDYTTYGKMGDDGVNTKSPVAGKNDMGGTTANILNGGEYKGKEVGAGSTIEGNGVFKQGKPQLQDGGNVNVPGGKAGVKHLKAQPKGHGAEKKGEAEGKGWGAGTGGPQGQVGGLNTKSPINGAPKRAK